MKPIQLFLIAALLAAAPSHSIAAGPTHHLVLLDTDNNSATGCSIAAGGSSAAGIEKRVEAVVDAAGQLVTAVTVAHCRGASFDTPISAGGGLPIPVGLGTGLSGGNAVEFDIPALTPGLVRIRALASDDTGTDLLATADGSGTGASILFLAPAGAGQITPVPTLGFAALLALAVVLLLIGMKYRRTSTRWPFLSLLSISIAAVAAVHVSDGQTDDWSGTAPIATDGRGDSTNGSISNDILGLFAAQENGRTYFRVDTASPASQSTSGVVTLKGGEVSLPGVVSTTFPQGAFSSDTTVTIVTSSSPEVAASFSEYASIFRPANRLAYEIRIRVPTPPASEDIRVSVAMPDEFLAAIPPNHQAELFAQLLSDGGEETIRLFELITAIAAPSARALLADVPSAAFVRMTDGSGHYEAILLLAATPGVNRLVPTTSVQSGDLLLRASRAPESPVSECLAASIQCPLANGCTVTSPFSPARDHPVHGGTRPHMGVDYRAPNGSDVTAAADGVVSRSYTSSSYGETIVVRHTDGSSTLYAHLEHRHVQDGATVTRGQRIATSDNSGTSSGPHLHLEYVPNGEIFGSKDRIDPNACVGTTASGSITVSDNGPVADDAFEVFLDGHRIGATSIGASNTIALNNLIPGNHALRITAIVAPDNAGTYQVTLGDGLTFFGGGTSTSGTLSQGASATFTIVVPAR